MREVGRAEGDGGRGKEERETEIKRNRGRELTVINCQALW